VKGKLAFDPADYDYGPATPRIRALLALAADIGWFEPPAEPEARADELFREHRRRCGDAYPPLVRIEHVYGEWVDFVAQCERVRYPQGTYDWKFGTLKQLAHRHKLDHGFTSEAIAVDMHDARPGDLFIRMSGGVILNSIAPRVDFRSFMVERWQEPAGFYWGFAIGDLHSAIEWELAEPNGPADGNPFVPLLECYAAHYYPFVASPTEVRMFSFTRGQLPEARLLR
jgi:hypothetical protein